MKLARFRRDDGGEALAVAADDRLVDLDAVARASGRHSLGSPVGDLAALLAGGAAARDAAQELLRWSADRGHPEEACARPDTRLLAPLPPATTIVCVAGNYGEHLRESGRPDLESAAVPEFFLKPSVALIGPGDSIELPGPLCSAVDYEGELAVVVGREARNVMPEDAAAHIAGYTNFNDVSGRELAIDGSGQRPDWWPFFSWLSGKAFDTFAVVGPYLVVDEIEDPAALRLTTRVNGELRQDAPVGAMILSVEQIVSWVSRFFTLRPGDVIATGTPAGVGKATGRYLGAGDVVEVEVDGLGVLRNDVVPARAAMSETAAGTSA